MKRITVALPHHSYDILIGRKILAELAEFLRQKNFRRALLVTDANVEKLHGEALRRAAGQGNCRVDTQIIPPGEPAKTMDTAMTVYTKAIEMGLDRHSPVIALGGGVVGDLAGFAAATYLRGVPFIQIPTSLLAQVDSGVGGKTAVNHPLGKNLIGAFYQPQRVFIDLDFLTTLPKREISTGLGEIIKYGVIWDEKFFDYLSENAAAALRLEDEVMSRLIARSCEIKADVVSKDEKEADLRRILNFGHTIGHAIEKETNYSVYNHGEAVAVGMAAAAYLSWQLGIMPESELNRLENLIDALDLPKRAHNLQPDRIYADLFHDKKTIGGKIHWVLVQKIGKVVVRNDVESELVQSSINYILEDGG